MRFFAIFLSLDDKFSLNVRAIIPCDNVQHLVKTHNLCVCMCVCVGGGEANLGSKLGFLSFFKFGSLVFL